MATGFDFNNNKWVFADGKLNIQDWINETPGLTQQWNDAAKAYENDNSDTQASTLFNQWVSYAGAVRSESLPQT